MDRDLVRKRLKELREAHYPIIKDFVRATQIHDANVRAVEDGSSLPTLPNMEKWVEGCGMTLAQFFAEIEGKAKPEHDLISEARALVVRDSVAADALVVILQRTSKRKRH